MDKKTIIAKTLDKLHTSASNDDLLDKFEQELIDIGNTLKKLNTSEDEVKEKGKKPELKREFTDVEKEFLKYLNSY